MKSDTAFVRMRSDDHLGDAKRRKKHLVPSNLRVALQKRRNFDFGHGGRVKVRFRSK